MVEPQSTGDEGLLVEVLAALDYPKTLSQVCEKLDVNEHSKPNVKKAVRKLSSSDMIVKLPGKRWERTYIGNTYLKERTALVPITQGPLALSDDLNRVDYISHIEERALSAIDSYEFFIKGRIELGWGRRFGCYKKRALALVQKASDADLLDKDVRDVIDGRLLELEEEVRNVTGFSTLRQYINELRSQAAAEEQRLIQIRAAIFLMEQRAGMSAREVQETMQSLQQQGLAPDDIKMAKALTDEAAMYGLAVKEMLQYYSANRGRFFNLSAIIRETAEASELFRQIHLNAQEELNRNRTLAEANNREEKRHTRLVNAISMLHRDTIRELVRKDDFMSAFFHA